MPDRRGEAHQRLQPGGSVHHPHRGAQVQSQVPHGGRELAVQLLPQHHAAGRVRTPRRGGGVGGVGSCIVWCERCGSSCLLREQSMASVGLCVVSTAKRGYPLEDATHIAFSETHTHTKLFIRSKTCAVEKRSVFAVHGNS